ncbi:hypothetical protein J19TS2_44150 [Cohnella xylanilytica]|nr:hypothetical protein J19TS2_44150 [Cohnella xylanilytica]
MACPSGWINEGGCTATYTCGQACEGWSNQALYLNIWDKCRPPVSGAPSYCYWNNSIWQDCDC